MNGLRVNVTENNSKIIRLFDMEDKEYGFLDLKIIIVEDPDSEPKKNQYFNVFLYSNTLKSICHSESMSAYPLKYNGYDKAEDAERLDYKSILNDFIADLYDTSKC